MILLSCGPILQPLIGMLCSGAICIILFFYSIKRVKQTDFYQEIYSESSPLSKFGYIIAFLIASLCLLYLIFIILALFIADIVFSFIK